MRFRVLCLAVMLLMLPGCEGKDREFFSGYVEGEYVYVASSRAGRLEKLLTERGREVFAGSVLFELESAQERDALKQTEEDLRSAMHLLADMQTGKRRVEIASAEARLRQAKAESVAASAKYRRYAGLIATHGISRQELDDARARADAAAERVTELTREVEISRLPERSEKIEAQKASVKAAQARVSQARWELGQKTCPAPVSGLVYDTLYRVGEWVPAGSPVVQLLPPGNLKIRFFVPESLLGSLKIGRRVLVRADGAASPLACIITYIARNAEFTPPVIYSNETRSKLSFMIEARPDISVAGELHPGQPVSVTREP